MDVRDSFAKKIAVENLFLAPVNFTFYPSTQQKGTADVVPFCLNGPAASL
jgi:hypothetical protein